jgi:CRISPR-associated protein Cas1
MCPVYLMTPGTRAKLKSESLIIESSEDGRIVETYPIEEIDHLVLHSGVYIGTQAISKILKNGSPIIFASAKRVVRGIATPSNGPVLRKAWQIDACRNPTKRITFSRLLVEAKIRNQLRVLSRLASYRKCKSQSAAKLRQLSRKAKSSPDLDHIRGIEGAAAAIYFDELGSFFPVEMPFIKRSTRPPRNPVNALLSYLYVTISAEIHLHILAKGLEPGWGFLHESEDRKQALALDLLEPYRAPIADALALDLINHRRLRQEHFETKNGGWYLKPESCKIPIEALEQRLSQEFVHNQSGHRTTLRQTIVKQIASTLSFIEGKSHFIPFHMN